jgi:hypothetical protein
LNGLSQYNAASALQKYLCHMHKEFKNMASRLQVIMAKNKILHPIGDFIIGTAGSVDVLIPLWVLKVVYVVARKNSGIFVSFKHCKSDSKVLWGAFRWGFRIHWWESDR